MRSRREVIDALTRYSFHDDLVLGIRVLPAITRRHRSNSLEIDLKEYWGARRVRTLTLLGCANLSFDIDLDVLADEVEMNVETVTVSANDDVIRDLIVKHESSLNVSYSDVNGVEYEHPARQGKLADTSTLVLFTVQLLGGVMLVAARDFRVSRWMQQPGA